MMTEKQQAITEFLKFIFLVIGSTILGCKFGSEIGLAIFFLIASIQK